MSAGWYRMAAGRDTTVGAGYRAAFPETMTMATVDAATLVGQMQWRYATKQFDPARPVAVDTWAALERAMVLSPSSYGLQPWRFIAVETPAVKQQLRAAAYDQAQVTDASHVMVIASRTGFGVVDVDRHLARVAAVRGAAVESMGGLRQMMVGMLGSRDAAATDAWCKLQAYLALGTALTAAAALGVDACPMEGFVPAKVDALLNLTARGYTAAVMAAFGHRAATDKYATLPKVRYDPADVIERA